MIYESINPTQLDAITVHNLKPYTAYRLRLIPVNIVGRSIKPSEPSPPFQTFQAPPSNPPLNVTTQSFNPTTILVIFSLITVLYAVNLNCVFYLILGSMATFSYRLVVW